MLAAAAFVGCSSADDGEPTPSITPTGDSAGLFTSGISVSAKAADVSLSFTSAADWSVSVEETKGLVSWAIATPASGKKGDVTLTVSILANTGMEARSAVLSIMSGDLVKAIPITQAGREKVLITDVTLSRSSIELYPGDSATLTATVTPSNTDEDKTVSWKSSDTSVVKVEGGVLTAVSEGSATITATAGSVSGTCTVSVLHRGSGGENLGGTTDVDPWK